LDLLEALREVDVGDWDGAPAPHSTPASAKEGA
jgi:hypothetical protein